MALADTSFKKQHHKLSSLPIFCILLHQLLRNELTLGPGPCGLRAGLAAQGGGHDLGGKVEEVSQVLNTFIGKVPVKVTPGKLLLDIPTGLQGLEEKHRNNVALTLGRVLSQWSTTNSSTVSISYVVHQVYLFRHFLCHASSTLIDNINHYFTSIILITYCVYIKYTNSTLPKQDSPDRQMLLLDEHHPFFHFLSKKITFVIYKFFFFNNRYC